MNLWGCCGKSRIRINSKHDQKNYLRINKITSKSFKVLLRIDPVFDFDQSLSPKHIPGVEGRKSYPDYRHVSVGLMYIGLPWVSTVLARFFNAMATCTADFSWLRVRQLNGFFMKHVKPIPQGA